MNRCLLSLVLVLLGLSSLGLAEANRDIWSAGVGAVEIAAVRDWFADKRPDMQPFDPAPDIQDVLQESWWGDRADNYNAQMWGWVTIPVSGTYEWWMHSDDRGALYVSTDETWANVEELAHVTGWQNTGDWTQADAGGNNMSGPMTYAAGQTLAVWAFMTEGGGGDNLGIGWIMPGETEVTYVTDYISIVEPTPTKAKPLAPAPGMTDVPRDDAILEWVPGNFAHTHKVYLSTRFDDVNDGTALVAEGLPQATTTYDPGRLTFGTTYYWRVDEVNAAPDFTVFEGKVWDFTIEPEALTIADLIVTASSEMADSEASKTIDGSGLTDGAHNMDLVNMWLTDMSDVDGRWIQYDLGKVYKLHAAEVWNHNSQTESFLGYGIKEAKIETSLDDETWTELKVAEIPQATGMPDYTGSDISLDEVAAQYVKITVVSNYSDLGLTQAGLAEVRFSYIPVQAREPQPADLVETSSVDIALSWRAGREVAQHEVVFSEDKQAVIDNSAVVGTTEDTSYDPGALNLARTYYWKINEVNEAKTPSVYEGDLWTFSTPTALAVDDMEMYKDEEGLRIWEHWVDGFGLGDNGSVVGNGDSAETGVVYEGAQSLPMTYDNTTATRSEAARTFDTAVDLTRGNPESLRLQVRGDAPGVVIGADTITVGASGVDLWGASDEGRFVYKTLSGDGSITAKVESLSNVHAWAKGGVMIRTNTDADSSDAYTVTSAASGLTFQYRLEPSTDAASDTGTRGDWADRNDRPVWVKVERIGNDFNGYVSVDGSTWDPSANNPQTIFMGTDTKIGLCVTSHDNNVSTEAVFSNISTTGNVTGTWEVVEWGGGDSGHPSNEAAPIYLRLADTTGKEQVIDHPNPEATLMETWDEWSIPLDDLTINATKLESITIGVGGSGASGKLYVDFIRTHSPPASETFSLLAQYPFDEGSGTEITDTSGKGKDATFVDEPVWMPGIIGTALVVNGGHAHHINGEPAGTAGSGINLGGIVNTAPVTIGNINEPHRSYQGMTDEVYVYRRALPAEEVADLAGK